MNTPQKIERTSVLGGGTMGSGIGLTIALAGHACCLFDVRAAQLDAARERIEHSLALLAGEKVIEPAQAAQAKARMRFTSNLEEALAGTEFVAEAVPEEMNLKKELLARVEDHVSADVVLATNTSGLSITALGEALSNPERLGGMHWFNPPEFVPLVEVVLGRKTSPETGSFLYDFALHLGKEPIMVRKDVLGFVGNRLQYALLREALQMVADGVASPEDVDKALKEGVGFRWSWLGPLETADLGGLDIFHKVSEYLFPDLCNAPRPQEHFKDLVKRGLLGAKTGKGFYEYHAEVLFGIQKRRDTYFVRQQKLKKEVSREPSR
jgi:3-hydroxybutyryl-CoA dehydrogenase